jgi:hypothetical protein
MELVILIKTATVISVLLKDSGLDLHVILAHPMDVQDTSPVLIVRLVKLDIGDLIALVFVLVLLMVYVILKLEHANVLLPMKEDSGLELIVRNAKLDILVIIA